MKTKIVLWLLALFMLPNYVKAVHISFNVKVKVQQIFSPKDLSVEIVKGNLIKGEVVQLSGHVDYLYALRDKYKITTSTSNEAEIIAYFNATEISLEDAIALLNNHNRFEEYDFNLSSPEKAGFHYSIEVLTNNIQSLDDYLKLCPSLETYIIQKDEQIFLLGNIKSHKEAIEIQDKFVKAGLKNNIIVAYQGGKQVPVYRISK